MGVKKTDKRNFSISFESDGIEGARASIDIRAGEINFIRDGDFVTPKTAMRDCVKEKPDGSGYKVRSRYADTAISDAAYLAKFDLLIAIDTGDRVIGGNFVSLGCFLPFKITKVDNGYRWEPVGKTQYIEHWNGKAKGTHPEVISWLVMFDYQIFMDAQIMGLKIGIITDHDRDNHFKLNDRSIPVWGNKYLPKNVRMIYASDRGGELLNNLIKYCHKRADQGLDLIERGEINDVPYEIIHPSKPYTKLRRFSNSTAPDPFFIEAEQLKFTSESKIRLYGIKDGEKHLLQEISFQKMGSLEEI